MFSFCWDELGAHFYTFMECTYHFYMISEILRENKMSEIAMSMKMVYSWPLKPS